MYVAMGAPNKICQALWVNYIRHHVVQATYLYKPGVQSSGRALRRALPHRALYTCPACPQQTTHCCCVPSLHMLSRSRRRPSRP